MLAIRVYDGESSGGIYADIPTLQIYDLIDGLDIDYTALNDYNESEYHIYLRNKLSQTQSGKLQITVEDTQEGKMLQTITEKIEIAPLKVLDKKIAFPGNTRIKIRLRTLTIKQANSKIRRLFLIIF